MNNKKEPVEITCGKCKTTFRLWVPAEVASEWEKGAKISCVSCGADILVRKSPEGYETRMAQAPGAEATPAGQPQAEAPAEAEARTAQAPPSPPPAPSGGDQVVLFIDDDRLAREMAEGTLGDAGIKLLTAKNSGEALKALKSGGVDLIVTDLYLKNPSDPESQIDGEELLQRVKETGAEIPAIITTGKDILDDLVLDPKWFELRVKGFIQKGNPFWMDELKGKIKEVLYK